MTTNKKFKKSLLTIGFVSCSPFVQAQAPDASALPQGGQVVSGQASISTQANQMNINQASQQAILNWQQFNIGADATVNFS